MGISHTPGSQDGSHFNPASRRESTKASDSAPASLPPIPSIAKNPILAGLVSPNVTSGTPFLDRSEHSNNFEKKPTVLGTLIRARKENSVYLSASQWGNRHLRPPSDITPLEERFKNDPLFFHLGSYFTEARSSASFSNYLPMELLAEGLRQELRQLFGKALYSEKPGLVENVVSFYRVAQQTLPILHEISLTNFALCLRNTALMPIELRHMGTSRMETGPWIPRFKQLYNRPNEQFFLSYLSPDPQSITLSRLGEQFATQMPGKTFLDLASGDRNRAVAHRAVAQRFGATDYVGVDLHPGSYKETWRGEYPALSDDTKFTARYFRSDMLTFLRRLKDPGPLFIRIEGLETYESEPCTTSKDYLRECMRELQRVTSCGDMLSVGPVVSFIHPAPTNPDRGLVNTLDPADFEFRQVEGPTKAGHCINSGDEYLWVRK